MAIDSLLVMVLKNPVRPPSVVELSRFFVTIKNISETGSSSRTMYLFSQRWIINCLMPYKTHSLKDRHVRHIHSARRRPGLRDVLHTEGALRVPPLTEAGPGSSIP
ncbi:unnamed protein product [Cuscuta campestris]|uniref:Uncharacterized protein n=1 Tax=Cuscuta campestris TaxID=132261 RepID=A0A484N2L7_9ASTE|nr:unnamed protein product [Cuscuta campestris]